MRARYVALAILLVLAAAHAAPPVKLPNGKKGSLHDLIKKQQKAKKPSHALAPAPEVAPFGAPSASIEEEGQDRSSPTLKVAKNQALAKRGLGCWGNWGGLTDVQIVTALKELTWWYTWDYKYSSAAAGDVANTNGIEFVPMIWNPTYQNPTIPRGTQHLLGYNEPNVVPQGNTDPLTAARNFNAVKEIAKTNRLMLSSHAPAPCPGLDYSKDCVLRTQWDWWDQYYAACKALGVDCTPDYVATHLYTCSPTTLVSYIDALWRRFGKPIWITEFACCLAGSTQSADDTLAQQIMFMRTAMNIMDNDPRIYRYAWFAPRVTDFTCLGNSANLLNSDGSKTTLGKVYMNEYINTWGLPMAVANAVTASISSVPLVPWDSTCFACDASSSFWNQEGMLKKIGNNDAYKAFVKHCRVCGYEDEWNSKPLI